MANVIIGVTGEIWIIVPPLAHLFKINIISQFLIGSDEISETSMHGTETSSSSNTTSLFSSS